MNLIIKKIILNTKNIINLRKWQLRQIIVVYMTLMYLKHQMRVRNNYTLIGEIILTKVLIRAGCTRAHTSLKAFCSWILQMPFESLHEQKVFGGNDRLSRQLPRQTMWSVAHNRVLIQKKPGARSRRRVPYAAEPAGYSPNNFRNDVRIQDSAIKRSSNQLQH